jgi:hypothetical protein
MNLPFTYSGLTFKASIHRPQSIAELTARARRLGMLADIFGIIVTIFIALAWAVVLMV